MAGTADPRSRRALRAGDVAELTAAAGFPCISVLMPTTPGPRLPVGDAELLEELARDVGRRLRQLAVPATDRLMSLLAEQVRWAVDQPTDRGLAVFVNLSVARTLHLPSTVLARAVVEQTFATRDLLQALHRTPPHVVLSLDFGSANLYQVTGDAMRTVGHRDLFSRTRTASAVESEVVGDFLRDVDRMLAAYRAEHPSPLVLAGSSPMVDRFLSVSRSLQRLAGRVPPGQADTPEAMAAASAAVLQGYLKSRRLEALDTLARVRGSRPDDVACGMVDCWRTVHEARPELLVVEEEFVSPGRDGQVHDLVDDLMELVILRGGQLAFVGSGDLADLGRVALVVRAPTG